MSEKSLEEWLAWQSSLHSVEVELGLERCRHVAARMAWPARAFSLLTVGGTNGKGSAVAYLEAILGAAGYRTGAYTSPHLLRYTERVRVAGSEVAEQTLCRAFARVEQARGSVPLTYFEFGTLAAMDVFYGADCDAVILEVGLGGRLDAVNLFDADAALVTTVAVDHTDWLGSEREQIGWEKAGIFRPGHPAICGDPHPPERLQQVASGIGAPLYVAGRDFAYTAGEDIWSWRGENTAIGPLPYPRIRGRGQLGNAAAVLMMLKVMEARLPIGNEAIRQGLASATLPGRLQVLGGPVERILDVAHNPEAAAELAAFLRERPCLGRTHALLAMLMDKDRVGVARELATGVDDWYLATLDVSRGAGAEALAGDVSAAGAAGRILSFADVASAYHAVMKAACAGDRVVVFGSFHTVAQVLQLESGLNLDAQALTL